MDRQERKANVFHIMYGICPQASDGEMEEWRRMAVNYINGDGPLPPLSLDSFRNQQAKVQKVCLYSDGECARFCRCTS